LKKITKVACYMVGATMIAGASAYMAMSKDARDDLKSLASNLLKRKSSDISSM
jgi:cytochrome bd-type quinol oxidase subunit 1